MRSNLVLAMLYNNMLSTSDMLLIYRLRVALSPYVLTCRYLKREELSIIGLYDSIQALSHITKLNLLKERWKL